jgi:hypothetical protein
MPNRADVSPPANNSGSGLIANDELDTIGETAQPKPRRRRSGTPPLAAIAYAPISV